MLSADYFVEKIDEATEANREAKRLCNDVLSVARGMIQKLQNDIKTKDEHIFKLESELGHLEQEVRDLKSELQNCSEVASGSVTDGCEDRWIPCSEKLPDNYADVLIQIEYRDRCRNDIRVGYHSMEHKKWFLGGFANSHESIPDGLVIAWQPLPEEYVVPEVEELVEEEVKFEVGDFVLCVSKDGLKRNAVYLGVDEDEECYRVLYLSNKYVQLLDKNNWKLTKYSGVTSIVDWLMCHKED